MISNEVGETTIFKEINAIIYIINLESAFERKKSVERELLKTNIPFQFVSAIDKSNINTIRHEVNNKYKRPLVQSEVGCFLSHIKVKELFLKSTYDFAIILEDDVELLDSFDEIVKKAIKENITLQNKYQWDVLKLAPYGKKKLLKIRDIDTDILFMVGQLL